MTDWTKLDAYVEVMPLVKRVQVIRSANDLARELFLYTQRQERARKGSPPPVPGDRG